MRADAERNAGKLRAAAVELFHERGLAVPLKEIAGRAGVSHGTLYNLFGSREALIDDVVVDLAADRFDVIAAHALACDDAWEGFVYYVEKITEIQATDPMLADALSGKYPGAERLLALCDRARGSVVAIIERAQESGQLRADFTGEDFALTFGAVGQLARAGGAAAPDVWRRSISILLDGLRAEAAGRELPVVALTPAQVYEVLGKLNG